MKAKIAKQEGECRYAKRANDQLERQIRILEAALKNERAKKSGDGKSAAQDVKPTEAETQGELKSKKGRSGSDGGKREQRRAHSAGNSPRGITITNIYPPACSQPHNSFLDTDEAPGTSEKERDQYLDNTTKYLKNCMKEIQYLLTPPQHPPPPQMLPNGNYTGLPDPPLSIEDIYARHQQRNGFRQGQQLPEPAAMPNHQPPPVPENMPQHPDTPQEQMQGQRGGRYPIQTQAQQGVESMQQQEQNIPAPYEEPAENVTHTYDSYGRAIPSDQEQQQGVGQVKQTSDTDGWNFDEEPGPPPENAPPDVPPPRRPDTDLFPSAANNAHLSAKSPPRGGPGSHGRKSSGSQPMSRRRSSQGKTEAQDKAEAAAASDPSQFRVKFALRGHLDVVRSVIFSGGGSPSEPEVCTAGDDGTIKRWIIPASYQSYGTANQNNDLDIQSYFTHRGHDGVVTALACCPPSTGFSTGGRASGDGWIFSGGQDATVRVWERGRVDPKATLEGHTDAVWSVCVLPATLGAVFGQQSSNFGGPDKLLLVSGSADGTVKVWAISAPPQSQAPSTGSRRGVGGSRRHSVTSGSNFPSSPQPSVASTHHFSHTLVHSIERSNTGDIKASPTCISPLSTSGETFVVSYTDSSVLVFDTRTGEEVIGMASNETYDGTLNTSINTVVATSLGLEGTGPGIDSARGLEAEEVGAGATGSREGVEGVVISGHEDRFVRFFDANSGKLCLPLTTSKHISTNTTSQASAHTRCSPTLPPFPLWA